MVKNSRGIAYVLSVQYIIRSTMDGARTKSPSPMCMCTCNTIGDNSLEVTITNSYCWNGLPKTTDRSHHADIVPAVIHIRRYTHSWIDALIWQTPLTCPLCLNSKSSIHITSIWVTINPTQYQSTFWWHNIQTCLAISRSLFNYWQNTHTFWLFSHTLIYNQYRVRLYHIMSKRII